VTFAFQTGWRILSEVLPLRWAQVDLDAGIVRLEPGTTKNRVGREFPIRELPELQMLLETQRAYTRAIEREQGTVIPYVFHRRGRPIKSFRKSWANASRRAGLVAALMWFFTKTKVGKKIVATAWRGIKVAIAAVADWWTKSAWPAIKKVIDAFGKAFTAVGKTVKTVWNAMKRAINAVWSWIKSKILLPYILLILKLRDTFNNVAKRVVKAWNAIRDGLRKGWAWINDKVLKKFIAGLRGLQNVFATVRSRILDIWRRIRDGLKSGWEWIRKNVLGRFTAGLTGLRTAFGNTRDRVLAVWRAMRDGLR
jgi:hypothetical protein